MSEPMPKHTPQPIIGPDGELIEADPNVDPAEYARYVAEPVSQPIIGTDGELIEADPNIDQAAYATYVAERSAPEINLDILDRRNRLRTALWAVPLVIVILLLITVNVPREAQPLPFSPQVLTQLAFPEPGKAVELKINYLDAPLELRWSPQDEQLAIMSRNRNLKLWDEERGFQVIREDIETFVWSPDGRKMLVVDDMRLNLLDVSTEGEPITDLTPIPTQETDWTQLDSIVWSPDGQFLAVDEGHWLRIVEVSSGVVLRSIPTRLMQLSSLQWMPDSQRLIGVVDGSIWEWSFADDTTHVLPLPDRNHSARQIIHLLDRNEWLVITPSSAVLRLTADFSEIIRRAFHYNISQVYGPQTGDWVTLTTDNQVTLYNYDLQLSGHIIWRSPGNYINTVDWTADGRYIAIGATDGIILWSPGVVPK